MKKDKQEVIITDALQNNQLGDAVNYIVLTANELARTLRMYDEFDLFDLGKEDVEAKIEYINCVLKPYEASQIESVFSSMNRRLKKMSGEHSIMVKNEGLDKTLYEIEDTKDFFKPTLTVEEFINYVIKSQMDMEEFKELLRTSIIARINFNYHNHKNIDLVVQELVLIFEKYQEIFKKSENKDANFAHTVLTSKIIEKVTSYIFKGNITKELLEDVNLLHTRNKRLSTSFFKNLPNYLQTAYKKESGSTSEGPTFKRLDSYYQMVLRGEELVIPADNEEEMAFFEQGIALNQEYKQFYEVIMRAYKQIKWELDHETVLVDETPNYPVKHHHLFGKKR